MSKLVSLVALCLLVVFVGCTPESEPEPVDPNLPPPPTAQDIAQVIITEVGLDMPIPLPDQRFTAAARIQMMNALQTKHDLNNADPVGKEALGHVKSRVDKRIREFNNAGAWQYVMVFIDLHKILSPDSTKYASLQEDAYIQLKKPQVTLHGMPRLDGRQVILMTFYIPATDTTFKERLSIGDEIHGLKLVNVFGNNRGVTIEYLETGERFVSYLPGRA
ncbi:MAG: hypothetical protein VCD00_16915 [Candidatus Hydrogenedentota bacterium]